MDQTKPASYIRRLRRAATSRGLRLTKYGVRNPEAPEFGLWRLDDTRKGGVAADMLTLEKVGALMGIPDPNGQPETASEDTQPAHAA